jgi:DNA-binding Lrp family transcriptional regulator
MTSVYVLINCDIGSDMEVINELKKNKSVKEIQGVFGMFDVLVKVEHSKVRTLKTTILKKIQEIKHVQSIQTLIISGQI